MEAPLANLQLALDYRFRDEGLLRAAVTHPSFVGELDSETCDNQRLEFLGDTVLQVVVTLRLFHQFPTQPEGWLTKMRAVLTREESLTVLARQVALGDYLRLGRGEERNGGRERPSILSDAFEAVLAAIFMDAGQELGPPARLINRLLDQLHPDLEALVANDNPKGALQEYAQRSRAQRPRYEVLETSGPDHLRVFRVQVSLGERVLGQGQGANLRAAEVVAAREAMRVLASEPPVVPPSPPPAPKVKITIVSPSSAPSAPVAPPPAP